MYDNYERTTSNEWEEERQRTTPGEENWHVVTAGRPKKPPRSAPITPQPPITALERPPFGRNHQFSARRREAKRAHDASANTPQTTMQHAPQHIASQPPPGLRLQEQVPSQPEPLLNRWNFQPDRPLRASRFAEARVPQNELGPPVDEIRLPRELMQNHDRTYQTIVRETGAFARPTGRGSYTIGLYGDSQAVSAAKQALLAWVTASVGKHARKELFPTINSLTPTQREKEERAFDKDVTKFSRRMRPPQHMRFTAIGALLWPVEEFAPKDVFGANLERLDPIRSKSNCNIIWLEDRDSFQIMSERSATDVQTALGKLRAAYYQLQARNSSVMHKCVLFWSSVQQGLPTHVALHPYAAPKLAAFGIDPKPTYSSLKAAGSDNYDQDTAVSQTQASWFEARESLLSNLAALHYRQGPVQLRIQLGVLLATRYKKPSEPSRFKRREFEDLIATTEFRGRVTQELGDLATESTLLQTIQNSQGTFDALDPTLQRLEDVKPTYSAIFAFPDTSAGNIRLEVTWDEGGDHGPGNQKWYTTNNETDEILDLNILNLTTTRAWHMGIKAPQTLTDSRIPKHILLFATTIKLAPKNHPLGPILYNTCKDLSSCQVRASYRYLFANSDVILEVTRFQDKQFHHQPPRQYEPRWGISIYRTEWDAMFTKNENLEIGAKAKWADDEETWFPADTGYGAAENGNGWEQMIEKLSKAEVLIFGSKDMYGGMRKTLQTASQYVYEEGDNGCISRLM